MRLKDRIKFFVLRTVQSFIQYRTGAVITGLQRAEDALSRRLAQYLDLPPHEVTVRMKDFPDGSCVPSVEFRTPVSDLKLAKVDQFFDNLAQARLNVRPAPRSLWN